MQRFRKMTMIQFKLFLRQPVALFFTIIFPTLLLLLFGFIWGNEPGFAGPYGYVDLQVPALAGIVIGTVAFMSIPIATATAREQKILRRYKATPMPPAVYIAADVVVNFLVALLGMAALVIVGKLVFNLHFSGNWIAVIGGFSLSALAFITAGYLLASLAPTARVAQVLGQVIFFPMMFLSGAAIPLSIMPESIQKISEWLPLTHAVKLLQDLWLGAGWNTTAVVVLAVLLVAGYGLSSRAFRWE